MLAGARFALSEFSIFTYTKLENSEKSEFSDFAYSEVRNFDSYWTRTVFQVGPRSSRSQSSRPGREQSKHWLRSKVDPSLQIIVVTMSDS